MSIIVSNCQHCDEQQFQTLSSVHYTIFSVVKLDLFIRSSTVIGSHSCSGKTTCTPHVHLVIDCNCMQGRQTGGGGGWGGLNPPPEFWMGGLNTCQPPLILGRFLLGGVGSL